MKLILVGTLLLAGCQFVATEREFDQQMSRLVGQDISEIITTRGPPTNVFDIPNGNKIYSWKWETWETTPSQVTPVLTSPSTTMVTSMGNGMYVAQTMPGITTGGQVIKGSTIHYDCISNLIVNPTSQRVVSYSYQGNSCKASEKKVAQEIKKLFQ